MEEVSIDNIKLELCLIVSCVLRLHQIWQSLVLDRERMTHLSGALSHSLIIRCHWRWSWTSKSHIIFNACLCAIFWGLGKLIGCQRSVHQILITGCILLAKIFEPVLLLCKMWSWLTAALLLFFQFCLIIPLK